MQKTGQPLKPSTTHFFTKNIDQPQAGIDNPGSGQEGIATSVGKAFKASIGLNGRTVEEKLSIVGLKAQDNPLCHADHDQNKIDSDKTVIRQHEPLKIYLTSTTPEEYPPINFYTRLGKSYDYRQKFHFKVGGEKFRWINGNERDENLCPYFENETGTGICFVIQNKDSDSEFLPPCGIWQKRFSDSVTKGLVSIINMDAGYQTAATNDPSEITANSSCDNEFALPTCHQYVRFIDHGETDLDFHKTASSIELEPEQETPAPFSPLAIFTQDTDDPEYFDLKHEFIHIANGICIGKMGVCPIFVHSLEEISEMYRELYGTIAICKRVYWSERGTIASSEDSEAAIHDEVDQFCESSDSEYEDAIDEFHELENDHL